MQNSILNSTDIKEKTNDTVVKQMKKRILLVNKSFAVGGIQSSMLNLIQEIKDDYEIDVCVFHDVGQFRDRLPKGIRIIKVNPMLQLHGMGVEDARKKGMIAYLFRGFLGAFAKIFSNRLFFNLALVFQKKLRGYDVAIAFHHEASPKVVVSGFYRFVDKKTDAPIKLGWIHYDPSRVSFDDRKNEKYMKRMTKIVCVSKGTSEIFKKRHPNLRVPVDYCYNMQDIGRILRLSEQEVDVPVSKDTFNCFSACRFSREKGMVRAVRAMAPVLQKYRDVRWYIAGDGCDMPEVKRLIAEYGVEDSIVLLGSLSNPYPYFASCDLYVHPSLHEAAPMVYGEAIICKIPILTTDNSSAHEMVSSDYGAICENSEAGLREAFDSMMADRTVVTKLKSNLESAAYSNQGIVEKLETLLA